MSSKPALSRNAPGVPFESLEQRCLFSAAARDALPKIGDQLTLVYQSQASTITDTQTSLLHITNGNVQIDAYAKSSTAKLVKALRKLSATDIYSAGRDVSATVPISKLGALSKVKVLKFAQPALYSANAGSTTSQGGTADQAATIRSNYNVDGTGVKVGIVSDSFNTNTTGDHYSNDIASGDLPSNVQVLQDQTGKTDEGRAIAQLIYDAAPGASLMFNTAGGGQAAMASAISNLQTNGAKVIIDDYTFFNEPMFQDGIIAKAATAAVNAGISYFAAAGNNAQNAYENNWTSATSRDANSIPSAPGAPLFYGGTTYQFGATGVANNDMQSFTLAAGARITLSVQWDSPYFSVSGGAGTQNNVDAYVLNADGSQIVGGSANLVTGGDPVQVVQFTNTTGSTNTYNLMLANEVGNVPGYIKYVDFAGQASPSLYNNSGAVFGHANAAGVESVGSAYWNNTPAFGTSPAVVETNSSSGPTKILFDSAGNRLAAPIVRQSPAIVAPDGGYNTFFGSQVSPGTYSFKGTSAAAAEAAGVAALMLQEAPNLTPAQIATALNTTALDMGTAGVDYKTGYGLIQGNAAMASVLGKVSGTVFYDNNGSGTKDAGETGVSGITVWADANNNGSLDNGEISATSAADGTYTLNNVPFGSTVIRQTLPGNYVAVNGPQTLLVPGNGGAVTANFGIFPTIFTTPAGSSSLLLQIDPAKTTFIQVFVGGVLKYTAAKSILTSLALNPTGNNNTVTVNFGNGSPIPTSNITATTSNNATGNALVLTGGNGNDGVTVDAQITTFNGGQIFDSGFNSLTINGLDGTNTFNFLKPQPSNQTLTFNGGAGATSLTVKYGGPNNGVGTIFNAGTSPTANNVLTVNGGTFVLPVDPTATSANLTVNANANVVFPAATAGSGVVARHLNGLNIGAGGVVTVPNATARSDRSILMVNSFSATGSGKLNLGSNDMLIHNGNMTTISAALTAGFANGLWNGAGIQSSIAAADTKHLTAIGVLLNTSAIGGIVYNNFDNQTGLAKADVLLKYTYYGDANLSGNIDGTDYSLIDNAFNSNGLLTGWGNGDFNYTNTIDGSDYTLLDNAFNVQASPL